jgi:hypothetical protein
MLDRAPLLDHLGPHPRGASRGKEQIWARADRPAPRGGLADRRRSKRLLRVAGVRSSTVRGCVLRSGTGFDLRRARGYQYPVAGLMHPTPRWSGRLAQHILTANSPEAPIIAMRANVRLSCASIVAWPLDPGFFP